MKTRTLISRNIKKVIKQCSSVDFGNQHFSVKSTFLLKKKFLKWWFHEISFWWWFHTTVLPEFSKPELKGQKLFSEFWNSKWVHGPLGIYLFEDMNHFNHSKNLGQTWQKILNLLRLFIFYLNKRSPIWVWGANSGDFGNK